MAMEFGDGDVDGVEHVLADDGTPYQMAELRNGSALIPWRRG
jgi:hypothetical protein